MLQRYERRKGAVKRTAKEKEVRCCLSHNMRADVCTLSLHLMEKWQKEGAGKVHKKGRRG